MIVYNMRFLLLNDILEATRSLDRVAVDLAAQQDEDSCRVRKVQAPENFVVLRHIALNLLK